QGGQSLNGGAGEVDAVGHAPQQVAGSFVLDLLQLAEQFGALGRVGGADGFLVGGVELGVLPAGLVLAAAGDHGFAGEEDHGVVGAPVGRVEVAVEPGLVPEGRRFLLDDLDVDAGLAGLGGEEGGGFGEAGDVL